MPRRTSYRRRRGGMRRGRVKGRGLFDFIKKGIGFLRKHKVISNIGNTLGSMGVPYASKIGGVAGSLGFGRRRRRKGYGLTPAGGSLRLAGRGRKKCNKMYC